MSPLFKSSPEAQMAPASTGISDDLQRQVIQVFALVGEAIAEATHALLAGDRELAKRVVEQDIEIDNIVNDLVKQLETMLLSSENLSLEVRSTYLTLLRILPEVERNGDLAEHVARRAARNLGSEMSPRSRGLI